MPSNTHSLVHLRFGPGCPTATHSMVASSLTAAMTTREKEASAAGAGDCGVSETTSDSGPSPARVLARTQKLYGWFCGMDTQQESRSIDLKKKNSKTFADQNAYEPG